LFTPALPVKGADGRRRSDGNPGLIWIIRGVQLLLGCSLFAFEGRRPHHMTRTIREAVAVFDDQQKLEEAVFALETHGFDRAAFSLLADEATVERKLGHRYRRVAEMEDLAAAPRETFFSRVSRLEAEYGLPVGLGFIGAVTLAGIGGALPALVAAGGGAALGTALGRLMHAHHARRVEEQLARGGLLLWVSVRDPEQERIAAEILSAYSPHDVHVHEIPVS
jgi:hypothetical protein